MDSYHGIDFDWEDRHLQTPNAVVGKVLYKTGGHCGPRTQRDYQLIIIRLF